MKTHFLYPSTILVSREPLTITTVLGSCVAIFLHDREINAGGMNHYMLPLWNGQGLASPKYGNIAMEKLIDNMLGLGCKKSNLIAKVFGGAELLSNNKGLFNVGIRNTQFAHEILNKHNIPLLACDTGGNFGRKIAFNTYAGDVKMMIIKSK
mgnify:CR=1 FL=1